MRNELFWTISTFVSFTIFKKRSDLYFVFLVCVISWQHPNFITYNGEFLMVNPSPACVCFLLWRGAVSPPDFLWPNSNANSRCSTNYISANYNSIKSCVHIVCLVLDHAYKVCNLSTCVIKIYKYAFPNHTSAEWRLKKVPQKIMVRKNLWKEWEWSRTQRLQWNQWKENKFDSYHSKLKVLKDWL